MPLIHPFQLILKWRVYISENKTMVFDLSEAVEEEFRTKEEK